MQNEHPFAKWQKTITFFMVGQAISLFGSGLVDFAIIWHITLTTKSGVMMAISTLCTFLPRLFISLFAGVWADRYNRKYLIMFSDAGIAFVTLLLAIIFLSGYTETWLIFVVLGIRSIGTGIQTPAVSAIIPQIVPENRLMRINGLNGSLQSAIMLLSPVASGALLLLIPLGSIFFIDVITAIIGISIMFFLKIREHEKNENQEKIGYYDDLKYGLRYVKQNVFVKEMLILYLFYFFLIVPAAFLSPLSVARTFGEDIWRLTAIEIAFSIGTMLGGTLIAWWGGFKNRINTIALSCFVIGILSVALAIPIFYIFLIIMFLTGIFVSFFSATEMTLFQEKVEANMQGRIFSMVQIVATAVMPFGMLIFGPIGDIIKIEILYVITGILLTILGIYVFFNKRLKKSVVNDLS